MSAAGSPITAPRQAVSEATGITPRSTNPISPFEQMIVPLDGSASAERALLVAADFASALGAGVQLLCVAADETDAVELRFYLSELGSRSPIRPTAERVDVGSDPAATIACPGQGFGRSLVCMSSHGHGMLSSALLGSVSTAVLATTDRPLLIVGPEATTGPSGTPVVACTDESEVSHQAIATAMAWAAALGASVTVVTVAEPVPASGEPDQPRYDRTFGPDIDADRYLTEVAARYARPDLSLATHAIYDPLGPAEGLVGYLSDRPARLVVLTTGSRTFAPHRYRGRAAAKIVRTCPIPVLLQPPDPPVADPDTA